MIKINLAGTARKKVAAVAKAPAGPMNLLPIGLLLIVLVSAIGGYWFYASLSSRLDDLNTQIGQAQKQKETLEAVIKQDSIYESRRKALDNRIRVIEGLKGNQVSPVVSLDNLADAIDRTRYVWLSSLDQTNTILTMSGTGTSVNAIADFVTNLEGTGYFRNINLQNAQDSAGNFSFSMTCEFSPPAKPTSLKGAN